jgi:hypothetical protein
MMDILDTNEAPQIKEEIKTKEEVINRLKEITESDKPLDKLEVDSLKQSFYKIHHVEQENEKLKFMEDGGKEEDFHPEPDPLEPQFKEYMEKIKVMRQAINDQLNKEKEDNLAKKISIIEKIKSFVENPEEINKVYNEFKKLQEEWNNIKLVPEGKANELWHTYQIYVEKFYDIIKINNEFRDYDFKKNLEIKTKLCEAAEKLEDAEDVISAFHQLQKFHQEFRDTGPVAKDLREAVWNRFKAASTIINKRHQEFFEGQKEQEQNNLDAKTVICEIVEGIDYAPLKSYKDWDAKTQEIIKLQAKWKTIGYAPIKMNTKIYERFRAGCDDFFKKKSEYFKGIKQTMNLNLVKKRELCEQAEALKDSTDWKETADKLSNLQKEWKTIGPVQKKYSDTVWKRFITACDYFFEQKKKNSSPQYSSELANMDKKKSIIEQVKGMADEVGDEAVKKIKNLIREFNDTGHVPYKEKDKLYKDFHDAVDAISNRLDIPSDRGGNYKSNSANNNFKNNKPSRERDRLIHQYESLKNDIKTYENNLGFLNSSSKNGNTLVTELNRKVDKLKADMQSVLDKIKLIDNPPKVEKPATEEKAEEEDKTAGEGKTATEENVEKVEEKTVAEENTDTVEEKAEVEEKAVTEEKAVVEEKAKVEEVAEEKAPENDDKTAATEDVVEERVEKVEEEAEAAEEEKKEPEKEENENTGEAQK